MSEIIAPLVFAFFEWVFHGCPNIFKKHNQGEKA